MLISVYGGRKFLHPHVYVNNYYQVPYYRIVKMGIVNTIPVSLSR
jgi:hypothetical protein